MAENCMSEGSALKLATLSVSPSMSEMLKVRSSEPKAKRLASLQAPHVMDLLCLPITMPVRFDNLWL